MYWIIYLKKRERKKNMLIIHNNNKSKFLLNDNWILFTHTWYRLKLKKSARSKTKLIFFSIIIRFYWYNFFPSCLLEMSIFCNCFVCLFFVVVNLIFWLSLQDETQISVYLSKVSFVVHTWDTFAYFRNEKKGIERGKKIRYRKICMIYLCKCLFSFNPSNKSMKYFHLLIWHWTNWIQRQMKAKSNSWNTKFGWKEISNGVRRQNMFNSALSVLIEVCIVASFLVLVAPTLPKLLHRIRSLILSAMASVFMEQTKN